MLRGVAAAVLLLLAALLTVPAALLHWADRTLGDTDAYVAAVAPLASDPQVQQAVADQVGSAVVEGLALGDLFSGPAKELAKSIALAAMRSQAFPPAWEAANAKAQQAMIAALSGEDGDIAVQGQDVVLDLSGIVDEVTKGLGEQGIGIASAIEVPPGTLQVRLMDAAVLARMQGIYGLGAPVAPWLAFVVVAMYAAAIIIAPARGLVMMLSGLSLLAGAVVIAGLLALGGAGFRSGLSGQAFAPAGEAYFDALTASLARTWQLMAGVGSLLAVGGLVWLVLARRSAGSAGGPVPSAGQW